MSDGPSGAETEEQRNSQTVMQVVAPSAMAHIQLSNKHTSVDKASSSEAVNTEGETGKALAMVVKEPETPPLPPVYVSPRKESKRPKKTGKSVGEERDDGTSDYGQDMGNTTTNNAAISAGSGEEHRRAQ